MGQRRLPAPGDGDMPAAAGEGAGDGEADARPAAGDDGDPSGEVARAVTALARRASPHPGPLPQAEGPCLRLRDGGSAR